MKGRKYPELLTDHCNFHKNLDTGGLIAGVGEHLYPPYGQTYFKNPSGRFCNGRLNIDFLMDSMDMPFLNPYMDAIGVPSFKKGCNFTVASSSILPATTSSVSPFSFAIQVAQFVRLKARVLEILKKGFKQPLEICCGYGGPPLNYDSRIACGQTQILNGNSANITECSDNTEYVNWDRIHYTDAANLHVSSQILTGKFSDPPFADKMPFPVKINF
ncbi:hypothetical protein AgCh_000677 [Apium graveolens]